MGGSRSEGGGGQEAVGKSLFSFNFDVVGEGDRCAAEEKGGGGGSRFAREGPEIGGGGGGHALIEGLAGGGQVRGGVDGNVMVCGDSGGGEKGSSVGVEGRGSVGAGSGVHETHADVC